MTRFDHKRLIDAPIRTSVLTATSQIWHAPRNHRLGGLISFSGTYKTGSEGQDDASFIRRTLLEFYELYPVNGLVIDCRNLDYEWGDGLDFPNRSILIDEQIPLLVVLHAQQAAAYRYAVSERCHRSDLDRAMFEMSEVIRLMKSRL
jgi:hypothetical protein